MVAFVTVLYSVEKKCCLSAWIFPPDICVVEREKISHSLFQKKSYLFWVHAVSLNSACSVSDLMVNVLPMDKVVKGPKLNECLVLWLVLL